MEFLTAKQLELNAAGYLISKDSKKPVNHKDFVRQQQSAEYIVKFAKAIKDKNFTASKVDNLQAIKASVMAAINDTAKSYVSIPSKPTSKIQDELVKYALDFVNYEDSKVEAFKMNEIMNEFNKIDDVESVGDYFTEGVVKLNAIYSIKQILEAVKITADKLK